MPHDRHTRARRTTELDTHEDESTLYEVLGISSEASIHEIKRAYKKKILEHHPDKNAADREGSTRRFNRIQEAYEVLADNQKRRQYDLKQQQKHEYSEFFTARATSSSSQGPGAEQRSFSFTFNTSSLNRSFAFNLSSGGNVLWSFTSHGGQSQSSSSSPQGRNEYEDEDEDDMIPSRRGRRCAYLVDEEDSGDFLT